MTAPVDPVQQVTCSHTVAVFASTSRKNTITGIGIIFRELSQDRTQIQTKPVFRHSEAVHHSRFDEAQPLAVIRALELALERGFSRLQLRSNYYHSRKRPHGYSRHIPWSDPFQNRLNELLPLFTLIQFQSLGQLERQVRAFARRAAASGRAIPLRERAPYLPALDVLDFDERNDFDNDLLGPSSEREPSLAAEWPEDAVLPVSNQHSHTQPTNCLIPKKPDHDAREREPRLGPWVHLSNQEERGG